jgi:hypothetical protein
MLPETMKMAAVDSDSGSFFFFCCYFGFLPLLLIVRSGARLINACSFSVFPCSLCLRSGDEGKAGNAGFLLSPPFSFFSLSSFISLFPFVLSVFLCVVLCFFLFVFLWYSLSILSLLVFLWFSPPLVRGLLWLL